VAASSAHHWTAEMLNVKLISEMQTNDTRDRVESVYAPKSLMPKPSSEAMARPTYLAQPSGHHYHPHLWEHTCCGARRTTTHGVRVAGNPLHQDASAVVLPMGLDAHRGESEADAAQLFLTVINIMTQVTTPPCKESAKQHVRIHWDL